MTVSTRNEQVSADLADAEPIYRLSEEVEDVARELIRAHPTSFDFIDGHGFRVAYLLKTDGPPTEAKIDAIAKCVKAPALWSFLSDYDFVIVVNQYWWNAFPQQREAIVLHELLHVGVSDKGAPAISPHDVEEFIGVAAKYGAWEENRKRFSAALKSHAEGHDALGIAEDLIALGVTHVTQDANGTPTIHVDLDKQRKRRRSE